MKNTVSIIVGVIVSLAVVGVSMNALSQSYAAMQLGQHNQDTKLDIAEYERRHSDILRAISVIQTQLDGQMYDRKEIKEALKELNSKMDRHLQRDTNGKDTKFTN